MHRTLQQIRLHFLWLVIIPVLGLSWVYKLSTPESLEEYVSYSCSLLQRWLHLCCFLYLPAWDQFAGPHVLPKICILAVHVVAISQRFKSTGAGHEHLTTNRNTSTDMEVSSGGEGTSLDASESRLLKINQNQLKDLLFTGGKVLVGHGPHHLINWLIFGIRDKQVSHLCLSVIPAYGK